MPPAPPLSLEQQPPIAVEPWWLQPAVLDEAVEHAPSLVVQHYRFGDALLRLDVDDPALLLDLAWSYEDCVVPTDEIDEAPVVCASVRRGGSPALRWLTFHQGAPPDPVRAAFGLLRPREGAPRYEIRDSPRDGWRLIANADEPVLAAGGRRVVIDQRRAPSEFLIEYLASATLAAQTDLLVAHAGSVAVGDRGLILLGASHRGKTTTSLHLGARGHAVLSDEVALIRLPALDLLPFRRHANLRSGPRAPEFAAMLGLRDVRADSAPGVEAAMAVRIGDLFPIAPAPKVRLRAAFCLDGFAEHAALTPVQLSLRDFEEFDAPAANDIAAAAWELAPSRRALRLLTLQRVLARLPCWLLKVGPPGETAALIERTLEDLTC